jgi:hypothetical protein
MFSRKILSREDRDCDTVTERPLPARPSGAFRRIDGRDVLGMVSLSLSLSL